MSWLNKAKNAASQAKEKITEVDTGALIHKVKASSSESVSSIFENSTQAIDNTKKSFVDIDAQQLLHNTKKKAIDLTAKSKTFTSENLEKAKFTIENIDWETVTDNEYQKENLIK